MSRQSGFTMTINKRTITGSKSSLANDPELFGGTSRNIFWPKAWSKRAMKLMIEGVGRDVKGHITARTKRGIDIKRRRFKAVAPSTAASVYPRPKRGQQLAGSARGSGKPPLMGLPKVMKNLKVKVTNVTPRGRGAQVEVAVNNKSVRLSDGRTMKASDLANAHNFGKSYKAMTWHMLKNAKRFRIPIKSKNPFGILTSKIKHRRLPKREFMGLSASELNGIVKKIDAYTERCQKSKSGISSWPRKL